MIYEHLNSPPPDLILSWSPRSGVFAGRSSILASISPVVAMAGSRRGVKGKEHRAQTPKKAPSSKKPQGKSIGDRLVVVFFGCYDREIGFTCLTGPFWPISRSCILDRSGDDSIKLYVFVHTTWLDWLVPKVVRSNRRHHTYRVYRFSSRDNHAVLLYNLCHPAS